MSFSLTNPRTTASPGSGSTGFTSRSVVVANSAGQLSDAGANIQWDSTLLNLGIGTTAPNNKLHVNGIIETGNAFCALYIDSSALGTTVAPSSGAAAALPANPNGYVRFIWTNKAGTQTNGWVPIYSTNASAP